MSTAPLPRTTPLRRPAEVAERLRSSYLLGPHRFEVARGPNRTIASYVVTLKTGRGSQPLTTVAIERAGILSRFADHLVRLGHTEDQVAAIRTEALKLRRRRSGIHLAEIR